MKQVIIIHGIPENKEEYDNQQVPCSELHWYPWIKNKLGELEILCTVPEFPNPVNPFYNEWFSLLDHEKITNEVILIGHSCGAGFLLRFLSEKPHIQINKLILVAPWLDSENYLKELDPSSDFFNFEIDATLTDRIEIQCMYSTDDEDAILESIKRIKQALPNMIIHEFTDKGHFTEPDLRTKEFPELLELILKDA